MNEKKFLNNIKFYCQHGCANCCQLNDGFVFLSEDEASKIAKYLGTDETQFLDWFTRFVDDRLCLKDGEDETCVFLEDNTCSIYPVRPGQCRTYPFWPENIKTASRWKLTAKDCPGIGIGKLYSIEEIKKIMSGQSLDSER